MRRVRSRGGFTLIEILVALAVFVIGMSSVVYLLVVAAARQSRAQDAQSVAYLVETVLAELAADPRFVVGSKFPRGEPAWTAYREHPDFPGYEFKVDVGETDPATRRTPVEVGIRYASRSKKVEESHRAILLRNIQLDTRGGP